ncbi:Proteophosphoglycan ppg4 [Mycena sanguinolenta]|uniref:Proteophosphoglycan ppg4 n=1 Tax=Mycena sanguinolenta TaxID=230812 RepID=A0A8H6YUM7_9AGAR|nr:Proteophosphoglycan ppg4 [Mycena sanguinolenta]
MLLPPPLQELQARNPGTTTTANFPPSTWIPIVVVVSVLSILSILACSRKSVRARMASMGTGVAVAAGGMPATRELTAEQLAGSINNAGTNTTTNNTNGNATVVAVRPRRTRRTPSQISTVSLPAYMKEPGEQELVVTRGPDGEDVAMPAASAVEDPDESDEGHEHEDEHEQAAPRHHPDPDVLEAAMDPRGPTPAYFEFVVGEPAEADTVYPPGIAVAPPTPALEPAPSPSAVEAQTPAQTQRRSGFFSTLFRSAPPPPVPPLPSATPSSPSPLGTSSTAPEASSSRLTLTHTRTRSTTASPFPNGTRHRASTSTSTLFSLGRKKSTASLSGPYNNTNASAISLASISSPLPHTLMKTEFTALPKAGLTPEQLMLISGNKDGGLTRFGAMGGEDEAPPPEWAEAEASGSGGEGEASGSGSAGEGEASGASHRDSMHPEHIPLPPSPLFPSPLSPLARADSHLSHHSHLTRAESHRSHVSHASHRMSAGGMSVQTFATCRDGGVAVTL